MFDTSMYPLSKRVLIYLATMFGLTLLMIGVFFLGKFSFYPVDMLFFPLVTIAFYFFGGFITRRFVSGRFGWILCSLFPTLFLIFTIFAEVNSRKIFGGAEYASFMFLKMHIWAFPLLFYPGPFIVSLLGGLCNDYFAKKKD
jgi:hypothetical protein